MESLGGGWVKETHWRPVFTFGVPHVVLFRLLKTLGSRRVKIMVQVK